MKRLIFVLIVVSMCLLSQIVFSADTKRELIFYWGINVGPSHSDSMPIVLKEFEKRYGIPARVHKASLLSTDEIHESHLKILSKGSVTPDILLVDAVWIPELADMGYLVDLTGHFSQQERLQFMPGAVKEIEWRNKYWGFPLYTTAGVIAYRKDILEKHKILPPKTWDELIKAAKRLQTDDLHGFIGQMARYEGLVCNLLEYIWSDGGNPLFDMSVNLTAPETVGGLELMTDIVNKYKLTPPDQLRYKEEEGRRLFLDGKALFVRQWVGVWLDPKYRKSVVKEEIGFAPIPAGPMGKTGVSTLGGWAIAVNKKSRYVDLAIKLAKYLTDESNQRRMILEWNYLPTRSKLYSDPVLLRHFPWLKAAYPIISSASLRPRTPYYTEISAIIQNEVHLALEGRLIPKHALERAEGNIRLFLKSVDPSKNPEK